MSSRGLRVLGAVALIGVAILMRPTPPWDGLTKCELVNCAFQTFRHSAGADTFRDFIENGVAIDAWDKGANVHIVLGKPRMGREADEYHLDFNRWTGRISFQKIEGDAESIRARRADYAECV